MLPYQLIFGGTTDRCHPKGVPIPEGCIFTHTKSHWQSVETYENLILNILVPYKNQIILQKRLPAKQRMILKHDLHFTHKDPKILQVCKQHNIELLFVPAGTADELQECDRVVNKTFKSGVKAGFRNYLHQNFDNHIAAGHKACDWFPKMTMGVMKPFIHDFIAVGIAALKTPEMKETIKRSFREDGRFDLIRSPEYQAQALLSLVGLGEHLPTMVPEGEEMDGEEIYSEDELNYYSNSSSSSEEEENISDDPDDY